VRPAAKARAAGATVAQIPGIALPEYRPGRSAGAGTGADRRAG
jgi:hypothetical protein